MFDLKEILVCPECKGGLECSGDLLRCLRCARPYSVKHGIYMLPPGGLSSDERYQQGFYDKLYASEDGRQVYDGGYVENRFFKYLSGRYFFEDIYRAIKPGGLVLDLGCGGGNISRNLFAKSDINLVNLDISEKELRHAAGFKRGKSFYVQASSFKLPFADASFDCIIADAFLHHIEDMGRISEEVKRVLKKGGFFFAFEPLARYSWVMLWLDILCPSKRLRKKINSLHLKASSNPPAGDLTLRISCAVKGLEGTRERHFFKSITEYEAVFARFFGAKNLLVTPVLYEYLPPRFYFIKSMPLVKLYLIGCDILSRIAFFREKSRFVSIKAVKAYA